MCKPSFSRRQFLAGAGVGSVALALDLTAGRPAQGGVAGQVAPNVSPELLGQLADYAEFPLPPDRAAQLAPLLATPLAVLRQTRPPGYEDLQPAAVFRVPPEA